MIGASMVCRAAGQPSIPAASPQQATTSGGASPAGLLFTGTLAQCTCRIAMTSSDAPSDLSGKSIGERKLVAVLYADMVGYSRLIGVDDAGTLARLKRLRTELIDPAIAEHRGRIVQTGGDSLLVVSIASMGRCAVR